MESEFASRLREERQRAGLTKTALAKPRYTVSYISQIEAGRRTPFIENGTSKEYPGGYSIFSVYRGGYTRSYLRPRDCEFCREWTDTTRQEYFGLGPQYLLGSLGTRNFSHVYGCDAQIPAASLPGEESLLSGGVVTPPRSCIKHFADDGAGGHGCLARRAPIGPRNIGRVRLRMTRRALPRRRLVRPGLLRAGPRSRLLIGLRGRRVRYIAVAASGAIGRSRTLRGYLRSAMGSSSG